MASEYASSPEAQPADNIRSRSGRSAPKPLKEHAFTGGAEVIGMAEKIRFRNREILYQLRELGLGAASHLQSPHISGRVGVFGAAGGFCQRLCDAVAGSRFQTEPEASGDVCAEAIDVLFCDRHAHDATALWSRFRHSSSGMIRATSRTKSRF